MEMIFFLYGISGLIETISYILGDFIDVNTIRSTFHGTSQMIGQVFHLDGLVLEQDVGLSTTWTIICLISINSLGTLVLIQWS